MTLPALITVSLDFSSGTSFGTGFVLNSATNGILGTSSFRDDVPTAPVADLTPDVYQISIRRGRNILRDTYEVGTCVVRVLDPNSYFSPQNTSSPYAGYISPLRKLRVSASTSTSQAFLFSGYVTDYKYTYPQGEETGYVDISCSDAFRLFSMANITVVDGGSPFPPNPYAFAGERIDAILNTIGFPVSMRVISKGDGQVLNDYSYPRTALEAIKNAEVSEGIGAFYIDGNGSTVFKSRGDVITSLAAEPIEFNQTTGIPYTALQYAFDDKLIINKATFTKAAGVAYTHSDTASIDKYFLHDISQDNLICLTQDQIIDLARSYVATRAETSIRIDAMTVNLLDNDVPTDTLINLDYLDNLEISNIQPNGSTLVKNLQMQGIQWDISPSKITAIITTLEPIVNAFIVGSSSYGIIGVSSLAPGYSY
jgi:hypothetical protein